MDNMARLSSPQCTKVFIQRDFSDGTGVRFQNKFPQELEGKIERTTLERTITQVNEIYQEAESLSGRTYCESCFACLTAYMAYLCMDTYYEKCLKRVARYIDEQNKAVYVPQGLMLVDPAERGLRVNALNCYVMFTVDSSQSSEVQIHPNLQEYKILGYVHTEHIETAMHVFQQSDAIIHTKHGQNCHIIATHSHFLQEDEKNVKCC